MEQANQFAQLRIEPRDVGTLESIAVQAGEREIFDRGRPAVLAGNNVIDLERNPVPRVRNAAELAAIPRPFPDFLDEERVHEIRGAAPSDLRKRRARDCRIESRLPT